MADGDSVDASRNPAEGADGPVDATSEFDPEEALVPETPPGYADPVEFRYPLVLVTGIVVALTIVATVGFGAVLFYAQGPDALHPVFSVEETAGGVTFTTRVSVVALAFAFGVVVVTACHELLHGLAYRARGYEVSYGFVPRVGAFYAAAFHQFQRRDDNLLVGIAPLVVLDVALTALLFVPNATLAFVAFVGLAFNTAGAAGDVYLLARLSRMPAGTLLYDSDARHSFVYYPDASADDRTTATPADE